MLFLAFKDSWFVTRYCPKTHPYWTISEAIIHEVLKVIMLHFMMSSSCFMKLSSWVHQDECTELQLKIWGREIKAHASAVARRDIRHLHAGIRTWIAEPVVKRATSNEPAETKGAQRKRERLKSHTQYTDCCWGDEQLLCLILARVATSAYGEWHRGSCISCVKHSLQKDTNTFHFSQSTSCYTGEFVAVRGITEVTVQ